MVHALRTVRPGHLVCGVALLAGTVTLRALSSPPAQAPAPPAMPEPMVQPPVTATVVEVAPAPLDDGDGVAVHRMAPLEGPDAFAMVFEVGGVAYVRLADGERATARGRARLFEERDAVAVVAGVTTAAMPAHLRDWNGKTVLVDGRCRARVVGFAEVSRVSGDPPGTEDYYYAEESERPAELPSWTKQLVVEQNVMLAARLDTIGDCAGLWARSADRTPALVADAVADGDSESAALTALLDAEHDDQQDDWHAMGGEGHWRDHARTDATTYVHPSTRERWIIAQATTGLGACGEPMAARMAIYRIAPDGTLAHVTDLPYANQQVTSVVDVDGDGQPELLIAGTDGGVTSELVDLTQEVHDTISIQHFWWGCGC